jgi:hypothetical protein
LAAISQWAKQWANNLTLLCGRNSGAGVARFLFVPVVSKWALFGSDALCALWFWIRILAQQDVPEGVFSFPLPADQVAVPTQLRNPITRRSAVFLWTVVKVSGKNSLDAAIAEDGENIEVMRMTALRWTVWAKWSRLLQ